MEKKFEKDFIEIYYDAAGQWVYSNWKGYLNPGQVQEGCELILKTLTENKSRKILNDNTLVRGTWTNAAEWIAGDWMPRAIRSGLNAIGFIYSPDVFGQFSVKKLLEKNNSYTSNTFKDINEAKAWLKTV